MFLGFRSVPGVDRFVDAGIANWVSQCGSFYDLFSAISSISKFRVETPVSLCLIVAFSCLGKF